MSLTGLTSTACWQQAVLVSLVRLLLLL